MSEGFVVFGFSVGISCFLFWLFGFVFCGDFMFSEFIERLRIREVVGIFRIFFFSLRFLLCFIFLLLRGCCCDYSLYIKGFLYLMCLVGLKIKNILFKRKIRVIFVEGLFLIFLVFVYVFRFFVGFVLYFLFNKF